HVEGEIARLGEGHPIVQTQYLLRPLSRADRLLSAAQLEKLRGEHPPLDGPAGRPGAWGRGGFVAGLDVAGADEADPDGLLGRAAGWRRSWGRRWGRGWSRPTCTRRRARAGWPSIFWGR